MPVGLLAYRGDAAVGWSRVVPRATLPGVVSNRALARVLADVPQQTGGATDAPAALTPEEPGAVSPDDRLSYPCDLK